MVLKDYQERLLDAFESFLTRTRELKNPAAAFAESTLVGFGHALTYHSLPGADDLPYVCLRVPTGGGKTRIGGQAIARVNRAFLSVEHSLVIWLVPSDPIRNQTLYALKTPGELLHEDMRSLFGSVNVLDIGEALSMQPATLDTGNTIVVATMQSFKRDTDDGLRVYRQNGGLMPHFLGVSDNQRGDHSLVDVIRLRRPFIVVDEAHNQGQPLAVATLLRLNPSCILELTATPDRASQPSNVLRSVSAATLQAEDMLKLPLELSTHPEWRVSLRDAVARLRMLEQEAAEELKLTGEQIFPVMLIQAERHAQTETFTPKRVKQSLIDDFNIDASAIAIATSAVDELGSRRMTDPDYPQFIITVDKLREGWDCPFAYVLFSFRNTTSATAVEQVLGRVLRMPRVTRKRREPLNRAYAYVVSDALANAVKSLRDGLVQSGFERMETRDLIRTTETEAEVTSDLFSQHVDLIVPLPEIAKALVLPNEDALAALPRTLREKLEISPESGTMTIKGGATSEQVRQVAETFKQTEIVRQVREQLDTAQAIQAAPPARQPTPAELGIRASIPLLSFEQTGFFDVFDESPLLDADWEIDEFDSVLTESEFSKDVETMRRARLSISQIEKIECDVYDRLDSQLALFGQEQGWTIVDLVGWLDRNLTVPYADVGQKVAWLNAAVANLLDMRGFDLDELAYRKFRLRGALERKLVAGLTLAKQQVFDELFAEPNAFSLRDEHAITFELGRYGYDVPYTGLMPLKRHFFPVIGNLKGTGEEFICAEYIANQLEGVDWWVRNVEKKPHSFWLQTASDKFYPDFVVRMKNGLTLVVEYKGGQLADGRDSREKKQIGELWANRSNGKCRFVWVEINQWHLIAEAAMITA
ncbi:MAG: DEAD/DEAH box helicase family protein [Rhodocyclaceae bacterium]|nr:DEAD/DEAH box helicase family protein [Rhodocyclaceae bacterium]MBP6109239.1 DEAD/DEAH box helicase family protein [Rhodocyclaceae bacterium]MBP6278709.1 DEAD/DEAH box helicase family protein [Rhodocyclaceae bacterium]